MTNYDYTTVWNSLETASKRAFQYQSHNPEKIAKIHFSEIKQNVESEIEEIRSLLSEILDSETLDSWSYDHTLKVISAAKDWFHSESNCASSFVVGPANFPTERNRKKMNSAIRKKGIMYQVSENSKKRIIKQAYPFGLPGSPISSSDPEAISKIQAEISERVNLQETMKHINKIIRKYGNRKAGFTDKTISACIAEIQESTGFSIDSAKAAIEPDYMGKRGFRPFQLSNNNANIRRLKSRIKEIQAVKSTEIDDDFGNGISAEINADRGQIVITFPGKPDNETRTLLKKKAFKWSRYQMAWVRKMTGNAVYSYEREIKPVLSEISG